MDEIIVRVLRTVACYARLRILSALVNVPEMCPTDLSRELAMEIDLICNHLARLSSAGLTQRRRSGAWCYWKAQSPYREEAFSGQISEWLARSLRAPAQTLKNCGVVQLCNSLGSDVNARVHDLLFDASTAFTNIRRVQLLRRITDGGVFTVDMLSQELRMSKSALSRHTSKLVRRGYAVSNRTGRQLELQIAPSFKTSLHAELFEIVRSEWNK